MAFLPEPVWIAFLVATGATGVAYYGYSSHKIGHHFGMVSVPYAAVYAALLVTSLNPSIQTIDRNFAVLMALVSWALYSRTLWSAKAVKRRPGVKVALVAIGFFALVVFPLVHLLVPEAQSGFFLAVNTLYRLAAVVGWIIGARPGLGPKKS